MSRLIPNPRTLIPSSDNSVVVSDFTVTKKFMESIYNIGTQNITGATINVNLDNGSYQKIIIAANTTFIFSNFENNKYCNITLEITNGGNFTVIWPDAINWPGGIEPPLTLDGTDVMIFYSSDGGLNINSGISMEDVK